MDVAKSSATENNALNTCEKDIEQEQIHILAPACDKDEKWVREYIEQFGEEPSFF